MRVHLVARPRTTGNALPTHGMRLLADGLRAAGVDVTVDVRPAPDDKVGPSAARLAEQLRQRWSAERPDLIHALGLVAVGAALQARPEGVPVVATFDEWPSDPHGERLLARDADAVLALSCEERDRWRKLGVRTLHMGVPTLPLPVPDPDASSPHHGDVVTLSSGSLVEALVDAMPQWGSSGLVLLKRIPSERLKELRARAQALGVADRLEHRPGLRGSQREAVWRRASVLVAGPDGVRHGGPVLEAAAHGVPSIAPAEGAYLDHVVAGVTGVLLEPGAPAQRLARAVRPLLADQLRARGMGAAGLLRIKALHDPAAAGARIRALYSELVGDVEDVETGPLRRLSPERVELALAHLPLATQLAQWYSGRGQSLDDLVQVASLGLVRAAERFDPAHGKEFHSFAIPTILGELRRHFRDHAWAVRVPRGLQETTLLVQRTSEQLRQSLGHEATPADLAQELGLIEEEVRQAQQAQGEARSSRSLDLPVGEGGSEVVGDLVGGLDPAIDLVEQLNDVRAALRHLPPRELEIVLLRFYGERTQAEIAQRLGISQVHVSRVLSRTLAALRDHVLYDVPLPESWQRSVVPASRAAALPSPEA